MRSIPLTPYSTVTPYNTHLRQYSTHAVMSQFQFGKARRTAGVPHTVFLAYAYYSSYYSSYYSAYYSSSFSGFLSMALQIAETRESGEGAGEDPRGLALLHLPAEKKGGEGGQGGERSGWGGRREGMEQGTRGTRAMGEATGSTGKAPKRHDTLQWHLTVQIRTLACESKTSAALTGTRGISAWLHSDGMGLFVALHPRDTLQYSGTILHRSVQ